VLKAGVAEPIHYTTLQLAFAAAHGMKTAPTPPEMTVVAGFSRPAAVRLILPVLALQRQIIVLIGLKVIFNRVPALWDTYCAHGRPA
jgi:hypothetical protein